MHRRQSIVAVRAPSDNQAVRKLQASLEDIATQLRANRRWVVSGDLSKAAAVLSDRLNLESVPEERLAQAQALISDLQTGITDLRRRLTPRIKNKLSLGERSYLIYEPVGRFHGARTLRSAS